METFAFSLQGSWDPVSAPTLHLISCHLSSLLLCSNTVLSCCPSEMPCLVSLQVLCTCYLLCVGCFFASCYPHLSSKAACEVEPALAIQNKLDVSLPSHFLLPSQPIPFPIALWLLSDSHSWLQVWITWETFLKYHIQFLFYRFKFNWSGMSPKHWYYF